MSPSRLRSALQRMKPLRRAQRLSVADYWTDHNVTGHREFRTAQASLAAFHWRNSQYANYLHLMPVAGFDGRRVLDFGCGPGHDLVGFGVYSPSVRLSGVDVSPASLEEARRRLALHHIAADLRVIDDTAPLPFDDGAFDHVHSSGVLHHVADLPRSLREIRRVLKPGGTMHVMIYNADSVWMHLKVAYHRTLLEGRYPELSPRERFAKSTDGEDCPIANCYQPHEFIEIANRAGFAATYAGAAVSMIELSLLPTRFAAIMDPRLPDESRQFLESLEFDARQLPMIGGRHAGVDAVFHLRVQDSSQSVSLCAE